jgi:hypothetical protein
MYYCQQALIDYINAQDFGLETVKAYAAELAGKEDQVKLTLRLPAALVFYGGPLQDAETYGHAMQVFVINETLTLDKETGRLANIKLVSDMVDWFRDRTHEEFALDDQTGLYCVRSSDVYAFPFLILPRFAVHYISVPVADHTK